MTKNKKRPKRGVSPKSLPGFGARLKELREKAGLSLSKLAALVGVNDSHIAHFQSGYAVPNVSQLVQLAAALGCTLDDLIPKPSKEKP